MFVPSRDNENDFRRIYIPIHSTKGKLHFRKGPVSEFLLLNKYGNMANSVNIYNRLDFESDLLLTEPNLPSAIIQLYLLRW